jgi:hypothetical protein
MNADRNLLFGILAFQNNFIDRQALLAAFDVWTTDKSRPLGEILVELDKLDQPRQQLLEALVREHLKQHDNDSGKSLAAVSSVGSVRADLERISDPDLRASLAEIATRMLLTRLPLARRRREQVPRRECGSPFYARTRREVSARSRWPSTRS